jgi:sulfite exporter TauE/SafE
MSRLAAPLFAAPTGLRGYALGLLLGFLPCGLLYGALAAAAASRDPLVGAAAMGAFAAGTAPALIAVAWLGAVAATRWRGTIARAAPAVMAVNAAVLVVLAWRGVG